MTGNFSLVGNDADSRVNGEILVHILQWDIEYGSMNSRRLVMRGHEFSYLKTGELISAQMLCMLVSGMSRLHVPVGM